MNALSHKIVFSKRLGTLVAVGEHTTSQGKTASGTGVRSTAGSQHSFSYCADCLIGSLKAIFTYAALTFLTAGTSLAGPVVNALPSGYAIKSGTVAVSTSGSAMTITQATDKASLNWNSFSIGKDASVNVVQNNSRSVLLNRVVGQDPSQIFGKLSANGQVILINPNGIVFGKDGSVTSSAFTASTFNLSDDDFAKGNYNFKRDGSKAGVTNQGAIVATEEGGYIALIGANVTNEGSIKTVKGPVVMAAGDSVALPSAMTSNIQVPLSGKVRLELLPSTINAMVANTESGVITTDGGQVLMHAAAVSDAVANISANVVNSGRIDTTGVQGGAVTLRADDGYIKVDGAITANSTGKDSNNQALKGADIIIGRDEVTGVLAKATDVSGAKLESNKGFVETSAHNLATDGVQVKAGTWLLDPDNIDITGDITSAKAGYSKIKASDIAKALNAGTSVTVSTTSGVNTSAVPYAAYNPNSDGNIEVNAAIVKQAVNGVGNDSALSLIADNGITINQRIGKASSDATGSAGKLDVTMLANGNANSAANSQGITLNNIIDANGGTVKLTGTSKNADAYNWNLNNAQKSGIVFNQNSGISAAIYEVTGTQSLANGGGGVSGVIVIGNNVVLSSTNGVSFVRGVKKSTDSLYATGLMLADYSGISVSTGSGSSTLSGSSVRISATGNGVEFTSNGNITIGTMTENMSDRASNIQVQSGTFSMLGKYVEMYNGSASLTGASGTTVNLKSSGDIKLSTRGEFGGNLSVGNNSTLSVEAAGVLTSFRAISAEVGGTVNIKAGTANLNLGDDGVARGVTAETVNITADNLVTNGNPTINGANKIAATGTLTIGNKTAGVSINVGGDDVNGILGINQSELTQMSAASLVIGSQGASTLVSGDVTLSAVTTTPSAIGHLTLQTGGKININGDLTVGTANTNKNLTLNAFGDVNLNANIIKNGTGNVVISAGSNKLAGDGTGGQVKTISGKLVSNALGKTYVYSGNASQTGVLSYLNPSLSALKITGGSDQNTDTNVVYDAKNLGISGSTASAQALFREKIGINSTDLVGTTLTQTYGDTVTYNSTAANADLLASVRSKLIETNILSGSTINVGVQSNNNVITLSKSAVINTLNGNLSGSYSGSGYLNANSGGYQYTGGLSSKKYTANLAADQVKVFVDKANLTQILAAKEYDGLATVTSSQVSSIAGVRGETFTASGGTATISDKNVLGTKTVTDISGLTLQANGGAAISNYNLDSAHLPAAGTSTNNVTITKNLGTVTLIAASNPIPYTYNSTTQSVSGIASATGLLGDDVANNGGAKAVTSGKNAGSYTNTQFADLTDLKNNYATVNTNNGTLTIDKANLVISGTREYDGTTVVNGSTLKATGVTFGTTTESFAVVGAGDSSNLSSKNVLQNNGATLNNLTGLGLGSGINGADAGNYNFVANNSSYTITQNTSANVALTASANTTYNGTTQNIAGAVQANGLVGNDTAANIGVTATLSGKNAGTSTDTTYLQDTNFTNLLANYQNVDQGKGTLTIQKASLTNVTGYKAFDGTNNIDAANLVLKGVNGEEFTTTTAGIAYSSDPKAAKNYVTNVSSLSLAAKNNASVELLSNYDLTKLPTNNQVIFNSTTIKPVVLPRTPNTAATKPASSVRATIGNANGFELASVEDGSEGEEFCSADHVDMNHCDCVESSASNGVFLCIATKSIQKVSTSSLN